ncbi:MAG: hypothetical protein ACAI25_19295 [Planctomycetota bacterium]
MRKTVAALALALIATGVLVVITRDDTRAPREMPGRGRSAPGASAPRTPAPPLTASSPRAAAGGREEGAPREGRPQGERDPANAPASGDRTLKSTVAEDVARIASALDLDPSARATIEALTLRAFRDFQEELARRPMPAEDAERLLSERQAALHARIQELLPPAKRSHYREVVGLGP